IQRRPTKSSKSCSRAMASSTPSRSSSSRPRRKTSKSCSTPTAKSPRRKRRIKKTSEPCLRASRAGGPQGHEGVVVAVAVGGDDRLARRGDAEQQGTLGLQRGQQLDQVARIEGHLDDGSRQWQGLANPCPGRSLLARLQQHAARLESQHQAPALAL